MILILLFINICITLPSNVWAESREPLTITKENQKENNIEIYLSQDSENVDKFAIKIYQLNEKCFWIYVNKGKPLNFGNNATEKLEFDESGKTIYRLNKADLSRSYILIDYCREARNSGYYYIVDLSTYTDNSSKEFYDSDALSQGTSYDDKEIKDVFPEDLTNKDTKFGPLKGDNQEGDRIE